MPISGKSRIPAAMHEQQDAKKPKSQDQSELNLETDGSDPSRAESVLRPNSAKEVEFVNRPKWPFTETGPKVFAYMPSILRRRTVKKAHGS